MDALELPWLLAAQLGHIVEALAQDQSNHRQSDQHAALLNSAEENYEHHVNHHLDREGNRATVLQ
uniref:Serine/threonine-protein kinase AFC1-like n=1 Tax=Rhizophora mucronata TaxID=61149 RepID=A0A2P2LFD1_RHIMU